VPTTTAVEAYAWTGSTFEVTWSAPVRVNGGQPGATAFDFDGDGAAEVVHRDEDRWSVLAGRDGSVLHVEDLPSGTNHETPVVANLDDDPWAEIVVPSMGGWYAIVHEVPGSATPRPIFNQMPYHDTNVLGDGGVPVPEPPHWLTSNTFHAQVPADRAAPCPAACATPPARRRRSATSP
jgi:hypothetical protein